MSRRRRFLRLVPAAWVFLVLAAPSVLWVFGAHQALVKGKTVSVVPKVDPTSVRDPATYKAVDLAILDRLPLRQYALGVRAHVDVNLFAVPPTADTWIGKHSWLYMTQELRNCDGTAPPFGDPVAAEQITKAAFRASGRRIAIVMTGTKLLQEKAFAPHPDAKLVACQQAIEDRFEREAAADADGIDLKPGLDALQAKYGHTFLKNDGHWRDRTRLFFTRSVLDYMRPGLAEEADVTLGPPVERVADLAETMEVDWPDRDRQVIARRALTKPIKPTTLLLIGDSQGEASTQEPASRPESIYSRPLLNQNWCHLFLIEGGYCDGVLRQAHTVVWQNSARHAQQFTKFCGRTISIVTARISGQKTGFDAEGKSVRSESLDAGASVKVDSPAGEALEWPRVIRIPVRGTPAAPLVMNAVDGAGTMLPCTLQTQTEPGGPLTVPVPAGTPVESVTISLPATPGVSLGTPKVITLRPPGS